MPLLVPRGRRFVTAKPAAAATIMGRRRIASPMLALGGGSCPANHRTRRWWMTAEGEDVRSRMNFQAKRELLAQAAGRLVAAGHAEKPVLLDAFVAARVSWLPSPSGAFSWHSEPETANQMARMGTVAMTGIHHRPDPRRPALLRPPRPPPRAT